MENQIAVPNKTTISETAEAISMLERAASNPDVDADKLGKLWEINKDMVDRKAHQEFNASFVEMKRELPKVVKGRYNEQTKSYFANLDDVNEAVDEILYKHGFGDSFRIETKENCVTATCLLKHKNGWEESSSQTVPFDEKGIKGTVNKTLPHAVKSATTYAKRDAKCAILGITLSDQSDDDGNGAVKPPAVTQFQIEAMKDVLLQCNQKTRDWFEATYVCIDDVPASEFTGVLEKLKTARDKANAGK